MCCSGLYAANLSEAILYGANLKGAKLNNSIWHTDDIYKIRTQIIDTDFEYIQVKDSSSIKIVNRLEVLQIK